MNEADFVRWLLLRKQRWLKEKKHVREQGAPTLDAVLGSFYDGRLAEINEALTYISAEASDARTRELALRGAEAEA